MSARSVRNALNIGGATVRHDEHGRYNLNDLHAASGALEKDQPWRFFCETTAP